MLSICRFLLGFWSILRFFLIGATDTLLGQAPQMQSLLSGTTPRIWPVKTQDQGIYSQCPLLPKVALLFDAAYRTKLTFLADKYS